MPDLNNTYCLPSSVNDIIGLVEPDRLSIDDIVREDTQKVAEVNAAIDRQPPSRSRDRDPER